jgi:hypothetical protein
VLSAFPEQSPFKPFKGFAGSAPRNGTSSFATNVKLRTQAIAFVSAGTNTPPQQLEQRTNATPPPAYSFDGDDDDDDDDDMDDDEDDENIEINIVTSTSIEESESQMENMHIHVEAEAMEVDQEKSVPEQPAFIIDTVGDPTLTEKMANSKRATRRAPSPTPSDSGDDVVVFSGRNRPAVVINDAPVVAAPPPPPAKYTAEAPHPTDDLLRALSGEPLLAKEPSPPAALGWASQPSIYDQSVRPPEEWTPAPEEPYWRQKKKVARPDLGPTEEELASFNEAPQKESKVQFAEPDRSEHAQNDTQDVATLHADWRSVLREKKASKKKTADPFAEVISLKDAGPSRRAGKRGRKQSNRAMRKALDSEDDDTDGEAAYIDYMENLKASLDDEDDVGDGSEVDGTMDMSAFEARASAVLGPSMVVDGKEIADDEVLPSYMKGEEEDNESDWESDSSDELNPDYDEISSEESLNASDLEDELEYTEKQQWEDELDLRQRRIDRMTDEQIARLFAKQEELGMTGDELLLEDGNFGYTSDEGFGDITAAREGLSNLTNSAFARPTKRGVRRGGGDKRFNFPNASMLADTVEQYGENGFDIMDMERPSLRPTKKGRKGKLPDVLDTISDDELKATLADTWQKDRYKKSQKKLEREELRREGLLGSAGRKGKPDLNAKYPLGMTMRQVHDELREFLQGDFQSRSFPAMAKSDRAALHSIATALNLNSKSQGSGKNRFPILSKTSRTQPYSPDVYERVMAVSERGFLTNGKAKKIAKGGASGPGGRGKGGFSKSAVGVRNGEIVGAGAAEIGQESMGHRLMLKMGWSKGMGLGKDGEGSLGPIEQKIRLGTAGLG